MLERLLSYIAPHYCVGCEREGYVLCDACAVDAYDSRTALCIVCRAPTGEMYQCTECNGRSALDSVWIAADYTGAAQEALKKYKFERARAAHVPLAGLLDMAIPHIFTTTVVVNIPTASHRIRERGYDHTALIARQFARKRNLTYAPLLKRRSQSRQLGSSRQVRIHQAKELFCPVQSLPPETTILLIDDIVTTGATILSAAEQCRQAGAQYVFAAACAYEHMK